ncbi:MAG TPA: phage tail length tape measure family protein, partial [Gemmatimonadaceae bacterium]|nr:phage tail length tape measure family protein [Gemmatimonadaceae bacterium]
MGADIATLALRIDAEGATANLAAFGAKAQEVGVTTEASMARMKAAAAEFFAFIGVGMGIHEFIHVTAEAQASMAQLEAGVRSTGAAAGFTASQLREMAQSLSQVTSFSHTALEGAQSILLLFQSLKGAQFEQATQAAADLATRLGTDVQGAARQLGKALEDPTRGLLALRRAGVVFTKDQEDVIKALAASGEQVKAQGMILDAITAKVGGSAAAYRDTLGGALKAVGNTFKDVLEISQASSSGMIDALNGIARNVPAVTGAVAGLAAAFGGLAIAVKGPA